MTAQTHRWVEALLVWTLMLAADTGLLWVGGAFRAELGAYPDEPSHYISGLMLRDYVASGLPSTPMRYAENYYLHYPKVAFGHFPPLFSVVEAVWMLIFPIARPSVLMLLAALMALTASLLYCVVRKEFGRLAGIGAGLLLIAMPTVQSVGGAVMAEALVMPLVLGAVICYGRYLETGRWTYSAFFGVLAALAILTKQVAFFLAFLPLVALLASRKVHLVSRLSFWLPAGIVAVMAAPWYLFAHTYFQASIPQMAGFNFPRPSPFGQLAQWSKVSGTGILAAAVFGIWVRVAWPALRGRRVEGRWASGAALIVSFALFCGLAPVAFEGRHLVHIEPVLLVFAAAGIGWLAVHIPMGRVSLPARAAVLALATGLAFGVETFRVNVAGYAGFSEAAQRLLETEEFRDARFLVSADASGEGGFIGEVATREGRPGHVVLRASKMLARVSWSGNRYRTLFQNPEAVASYLESMATRVLIVGSGASQAQTQHERIIEEMIKRYPDRWQLIGTYPRSRVTFPPGREVRVYRSTCSVPVTPGKIRIDVRYRLGRFVEN